MRDLAARLRALTPRQILAIGWLGLIGYAYPGFMSYDSVLQLDQARSGFYVDGHPPAMAGLWRLVELVIAGPAGMLMLQTTCFLAGSYFVFQRVMSRRAAAVVASLVLWFPPIAAVMGVVWKDSQMAAFLLLGFGLILRDDRRSKLYGVAAFLAATLMRHNAMMLTGPLLAVCFVWDPAHRFVKRYGIAVGIWVVLTLAGQFINSALANKQQHFWHTNLALCDMAGTLRYAEPTISDEELHTTFVGIRLLHPDAIHAFARRGHPELQPDYAADIWKTAFELFALPDTAEERAAVVRAWKQVVFAHPRAYFTYRSQLFRRLIGITEESSGSPVYNWFVDIQGVYISAMAAEHDANPGRIQDLLRRGIHVVGVTPIFDLRVYALLTLVLVAFSFRDRRIFALLASGVANEAGLFFLAPTTDWRYSFWLVVTAVVAAILVVASRIQRSAVA